MKKKLFFVGANKTGTSTIDKTFQQMKVGTIHNARWHVQSWNKNEDYFKKNSVFGDGLVCPNLAWLDKTFDAFFILNTRNLKDWAVSVWNHIQRKRKEKRRNSLQDMKHQIRVRNTLHTEVFKYFDKSSLNFTVLDLPGSTPKVVLKKLRMISGLPISRLVSGNRSKNKSGYVKNPVPVMMALKELGIGPEDYNKLLLDI